MLSKSKIPYSSLFYAVAALGATVAAFGIAGLKHHQSTHKIEKLKVKPPIERPTPKSEGNKVQGNTIRIGLVTSITGEQTSWGKECYQGVALAVEEFNKHHNIQGKKVELIVGDASSKAELGRSAAENLISKGVLGLIGDMSSGITAQIALSAFDHGIPLIINGGTRPDLTDIGTNIFRVNYHDNFQGSLMAIFAYKELMMRRAALITDRKQPYSVSLSKNFKERFEQLGGKVVGEEFYESGQVDFRSILTRLKVHQPDTLFASGYCYEVGPIIRQCNQIGLNVTFLGGDGWDSSELLTSAGHSILKGYFCNHYANNDPRPEVRSFLKTWSTKFEKPPAYMTTSVSYDAASLMLDALRRCETLDSKSLTNAIENTINYQGVTGKITLKGAKGNPQKRAIIVQLEPEGQKFRKAYEYKEILNQ